MKFFIIDLGTHIYFKINLLINYVITFSIYVWIVSDIYWALLKNNVINRDGMNSVIMCA
jgi:hypothetical protein